MSNGGARTARHASAGSPAVARDARRDAPPSTGAAAWSAAPAHAARSPIRPAAPLAATLIAALAVAACGEDFRFEPGPRGGDAEPLAAVYDATADYPALAFPEFPATGLSLDVTLEFDPNGPAPSGDVTGTVTIREAKVGGLSRAFAPTSPLAFTGRLIGDVVERLTFGPVTVGTTVLNPEWSGALLSGGRRMEGTATFTNLAEAGTWIGVKQRRYLIAGSDFGLQGTVSVVTVRYESRFSVAANLELISGDPIATYSRGTPLIVNRLFFDNVQVLDPSRAYLTAIQFSTGGGSNPHDALRTASGALWITRYEPPFDDVLVADPDTGDALGTIPLGPLATNASGTPRPDRLVEANGLVLVTLQNIDATFTEYGPGRAAFLDPATGDVVKALTLAGQNPFGPPSIHPDTGEIYLADAGIFQGLLPKALTGGIEVIDPIALATRGLLVDDDDLGGNVAGVAVASAARGWAVVVTQAGANGIVGFDPATGGVLGTVFTTSALIPEIRYDGDGWLLVAEHDLGDPALRILDATSGTPVARIRLSLPPASIAILARDVRSGS